MTEWRQSAVALFAVCKGWGIALSFMLCLYKVRYAPGGMCSLYLHSVCVYKGWHTGGGMLGLSLLCVFTWLCMVSGFVTDSLLLGC